MLYGKCCVFPFLFLLSLLLVPGSAFSWTQISQQHAGGGAKEVPVNRDISRVQIVCQGAPVIINTVVMREGGKKTPFTLGKRFAVNEAFVLSLGGKHHVTGLRISDDLKGSYLVRVE